MRSSFRATIAAGSAAAVLLQSPALAIASVGGDNLKGLRSMHVVVEAVRPNACGVTTQALETGLRSIVAQSRLKFVPYNVTTPALHLRVTMLSDCSAAYLDLAVYTTAVIEPTKVPAYTATIWEDGSLLGGWPEMRSRVAQTVEDLAKEFVADWSAANP